MNDIDIAFDKKERQFVGKKKRILSHYIDDFTRISIFEDDGKYTLTRCWRMNDNIAISVDLDNVNNFEIFNHLINMIGDTI